MAPPFLLGLAVAFGGALLLASGSELQSRAVYDAGGRWRAFLRAPRWFAGLGLLGVAVSTNFVALALAPVSAVQSVSVAALAASAVFGTVTGRVAMTRAGAASVLSCIAGILGFIAVIAAHPAEGTAGAAPHGRLGATTAILGGLTAVGLIAAVLGGARRGTGAGPRLLGLVAGAAVFGSITTVFKTIVTAVLERSARSVLAEPGVLLALGLVAVAGLVANVLLQRSHRCFPAPVVVVALTIVDPLTAAVIGISVLGEAALAPPSAAGLIACGALACVGVIGVSRLRRTARPRAPDAVAITRTAHPLESPHE